MAIFSSIGRLAAEFTAARARYRTERTIRSLPLELQKDIGWPDAHERAVDYRQGIGSWSGTKQG